MRLIDADKLKRTEGIFQYQISESFDRISASAYTFEDVENAPTVDAIPIEWIKETIKLAENVQASKYAEHLRILLEDWEKENEQYVFQ